MFKEEENKRLLSKEKELKDYYAQKVEKNQKESKLLQEELNMLEQMEKEMWKQLKQSKIKADEINRISVNKIKDPQRMNYKDKSYLTERSSNRKAGRPKSMDFRVIGCATPKPFVVKKIGFDDSYHNIHQSKRTPNKVKGY